MTTKVSHRFVTTPPFQRARITVFGRTRDEALETARTVRLDLVNSLPRDCTCWNPLYAGYSNEERSHMADISVTLGLDKEASKEGVERTVVASNARLQGSDSK